MSELAKQLFDGLKHVAKDVGAEVHRQGVLGSSEVAAALFKGDPFVMYGPGQRSANVEQEHGVFGQSASTPEQQATMTQEIDQPSREMQMERGR